MPIPAFAAAKPSKSIFDPFNSSATGHQRADNRLSGSISWRDSRSLKLREQLSSGLGGGKRVSDTVGAGSLEFGQDGRTESGGFVPGAKGLRTSGQKSLLEYAPAAGWKTEKEVERPGKRVKREKVATNVVNPFTPYRKSDGMIRETSWTSHESSPSHLLSPLDATDDTLAAATLEMEHGTEDTTLEKKEQNEPCPQIFAHLTIYINGSTMPFISDHKLKRLISMHGANLSIHLGRKTVTHVILGKPAAGVSRAITSGGKGCGGGLAGSKIQKEILRIGGKGVKFVTAEWVVKSVEAGKRLPESGFEGMRLAPKGVGSVAAMFAEQHKANSGVKRKEPD